MTTPRICVPLLFEGAQSSSQHRYRWLESEIRCYWERLRSMEEMSGTIMLLRAAPERLFFFGFYIHAHKGQRQQKRIVMTWIYV